MFYVCQFYFDNQIIYNTKCICEILSFNKVKFLSHLSSYKITVSYSRLHNSHNHILVHYFHFSINSSLLFHSTRYLYSLIIYNIKSELFLLYIYCIHYNE